MSRKRRSSLSVVLTILAISMLSFGSVVPATIADEQGEPPIPPCEWGQPRFDKVNYVVIDEIADSIKEMKAGTIDFTGAGTTDMQADLLAHGFNLSYGSRARFGYLGVNCRSHDGTSGEVNQPLNYSEFRTALHYLYGFTDKDLMITAIYGTTTLALDTIVPFAQTTWCASNDPTPGLVWGVNPKIGGPSAPMPTSPAAALALLTGAHFEIKDGPDADGKNELYNPDGTIVRPIDVWYSVGDALLKEYIETYIGGGHGTLGVNEQFKQNLHVDEGPGDIPCGGLTYPLRPVPIEFGTMVVEILFTHDFDMNSIGWINLGRYPDWMYDMFHSNFAGDGVFKGYNYVGFRNATADAELETIMFDLSMPLVGQAVYDFQFHMLYEWNAYIQMNTGIAVAAYGRGGGAGGTITRYLEDWMHMENYGADNGYTWAQMHWEDNPTGACEHVNRRQAEPPSEFTPWYSDELYEWEYMDRIYEGLLDIHALSLTDEPFIACDWNVTYWSWPELDIEEGMRVTFWLKDDVYWQDGYKLTSEDIKANWDYLKKYSVPRYATMWEHLVYCETEGPYKVTAYIDTTSLWLYSSYAGTGLFYPKWMLHGIDELVADPADPWGVTHPSGFEAWKVNYRDFVDYCKSRGIGIEYGPWVDPNSGIPTTVPSGKWVKAVGGELKCLIGTGAYYFYYYDPTLEEGAILKNTAWWAGESEVFCNIDASGIPDRSTGMEPYERTLYHQRDDTGTIFEIQVRNLCGHNITDLYVTATLDCEPFDTRGPFVLERWTHICVQFCSPVVGWGQHVINQIVSIGPPEPVETTYQCDSFDDDHTGWVRYGASPYLDHIDYPTNYIESYDQSHLKDYPLDAFIGDFDFPIPPYEELDRLYKIYLCLYCMQNGNKATSTLNVYGACCRWWLATITPPANSAWDWVCVDLELKTDYGQRMLHRLASEICLESIVKGTSCIHVDKAMLRVVTIPNMCCKGDKKVWWTLRRGWCAYLTSDAAAGQKDVVVADSSIFSVGEPVEIEDDNAWENNYISAIGGNTLTMEYNLVNTYTVTANGKVCRKGGQPGVRVYLLFDAAADQKYVTVWNVEWVWVGDRVKIKDDNAWEYNYISAIDTSTNTLTMEYNLEDTYRVSANARVCARWSDYWFGPCTATWPRSSDEGTVCCTGDETVWWASGGRVLDAWPDIGGTPTETVMKEFNIPEITAKQTPLPDCKIDMKDVATASKAFGAKPGHPRWWPAADIIKDFKVDMKDIATIARYFGMPY